MTLIKCANCGDCGLSTHDSSTTIPFHECKDGHIDCTVCGESADGSFSGFCENGGPMCGSYDVEISGR